MRKIKDREITGLVKKLLIRANFSLRKDILDGLKHALCKEKKPSARNILKILIENARIARHKFIPICQDTGMVEIFCRIGQEVFVEGDITAAINKGIEAAYLEGYLRKSVVSDPLTRKNTNTNTPGVIHYDIVKGSKIGITVVPKGFGSENASSIKMLKPTDTQEEIVNFVLDTVRLNGYNACPPLVIGIGIGGTLDKAACMATEAIIRPISKKNPKKHYAMLEDIILKKLNETGIGPAGMGGRATCLGVNILSFPTHIAGLPLCVKISCHATRSATGVI
jgi:fumarate hydratase subunit alpha